MDDRSVTERMGDQAEDSGIDSEGQLDSTPMERPLELVVTKKSPAPRRHWKKFLKDQAVPKQEAAEQVAHALLSLGQDRPRPLLASHVLNRQTSSWSPNRVWRRCTIPNEQSEPENLCLRPASEPLHVRLGSASEWPLRPLPINYQVRLPTVPLPPASPLASATSKPFACSECRKSFSTQSGHTKHMLLHASNQIAKSFSCKYCSKGYTSLSALKMHIRTHTLPCKCDVCGKSFSRPWLLQGHVRTHTGDKPFACNFCTRSFADKSNLRAHLQTHLQTKKYCCPGCRKTFSRMSLLNKHTDGGCAGLQSRNEECVRTLIGLSSGDLIRI